MTPRTTPLTTPSSSLGVVDPPSVLYAFDYDEWAYYLHGHDEGELPGIDEPGRLEWEPVWMCPVPYSSLDESERPDDYDPVERDEQGRFKARYAWIGCAEGEPGAEPFLAVRYRTDG